MGERYGRWTVIRDAGRNLRSARMVEARCQCGTVRIVHRKHLVSGASTSCGCGHIEHGHTANGKTSPEYRAWVTMNQRCGNPANPRFKDYGARGITVCQEWQDSFTSFLNDLGPRPSADHSIDRRENDKGYSPSNCRWATRSEQQRNTRRTLDAAAVADIRRRLEEGESQASISRATGMARQTIRNIQRGQS